MVWQLSSYVFSDHLVFLSMLIDLTLMLNYVDAEL